MKKVIVIFTILFSMTSVGFPKTSTKVKATETVTPSSSPTATPSSTPNPGPQWVPPPSPGPDLQSFTNQISGILSYDAVGGSQLLELYDFTAKRKFDESESVLGTATLRFVKNTSTSFSASDIQVREAKITFIEPFLKGDIGRINIKDQISPTQFFGSYPTMGLHYLDGASLFLPIFLKFGVEDLNSFSSPPAGLSFYYFPTVYSTTYANIDTTQAAFLAQLRVKFNIVNIPSTVRVNFEQSGNPLLAYSAFNSDPSLDASIDCALDKVTEIYVEGASQDAGYFNATMVGMAGLRLQRVQTFGPLSLDEINLEYQVPLGTDLNDTFTGGNQINHKLATLPQNSIYGSVKFRFKQLFLEFDITNGPGDFTLARLNSTNAVINGQPITQPVGPGNQTGGLDIPLVSPSYSTWAYLFRLGTQF